VSTLLADLKSLFGPTRAPVMLQPEPAPLVTSCFVLGLIKSLDDDKQKWKPVVKNEAMATYCTSWEHQPSTVTLSRCYQWAGDYGMYCSSATLLAHEAAQLLAAWKRREERAQAKLQAIVDRKNKERNRTFEELGCPEKKA
jgi:hypothetical protein